MMGSAWFLLSIFFFLMNFSKNNEVLSFTTQQNSQQNCHFHKNNIAPSSLSPITFIKTRLNYHTKLDSHVEKEGRGTSKSTVPLVDPNESNRTVTILSRGPNHIIAMKPPSVLCHHSNWAGSRKRTLKIGEEPEIPMLQRVRDAIDSLDCDENGSDINDEIDQERKVKRVNLVHRLDRGASGALLFAFADSKDESDAETENKALIQEGNVQEGTSNGGKGFVRIKKERKKGATATLQAEMAKSTTTKTYVALVRGEGILRGEDFNQKGWFEVNRPIKDEKGRLNDATTMFRFVAGQAEPENDDDDRRINQPRMSLVLARPQDGRWHQIRRHLNGISHPILGDTSHGSSKTNREWKERRNLPRERICLHLARLQIPETEFTDAIDCACPLPQDMLDILQVYAPNVLKEALPLLESEGILVNTQENKYVVGSYKIPEKLLKQMLGVEESNGDDDSDKSSHKTEVEILSTADNFVVVSKPPGVVVHNSPWTNKRKKEATPMVQQVRDAVGRKVNPIHRLDRSASGCLVFTFSDGVKSQEITKTLIDSLQSEDATKTYIALCDGDGIWNGVNFVEKGWFTVDIPVKDENGKIIDAVTDIRFITGVSLPTFDDVLEGSKVSVVLAKPRTGKYHQIRQHLASGTIGHAILGDSSHGRSRTNRIWKKKRHLIKERTCLHLLKVELPPTKYSPKGIKSSCPLPEDMNTMLTEMPELWEKAKPILLEEGLTL